MAAATLDLFNPLNTTRDPVTLLSLELLMTLWTDPEDPLEAACTRLRACAETDIDTDRVTHI